jgi:hypothetical protein
MLITTAPAPSQRSSPCAILEGVPLFKRSALEGDPFSKKSASEGDPLLKKSAPVELIVNPTIRSATAAGIDLTFVWADLGKAVQLSDAYASLCAWGSLPIMLICQREVVAR